MNSLKDAPDAVLSERDIALIEQFGEGLSKEEACQWFGLEYSALLPADKLSFDQAYHKGRANMIFYAVNKLKEQMNGRNGMQAALAALSQFGTEWDKAENVAGVKAFKITMDN